MTSRDCFQPKLLCNSWWFMCCRECRTLTTLYTCSYPWTLVLVAGARLKVSLTLQQTSPPMESRCQFIFPGFSPGLLSKLTGTIVWDELSCFNSFLLYHFNDSISHAVWTVTSASWQTRCSWGKMLPLHWLFKGNVLGSQKLYGCYSNKQATPCSENK